MLALESPALLFFASGVLLQVTVLRYGEWNLYAPAFVGYALSIWLALVVVFFLVSTPHEAISAALSATKTTWSGIAGIVASMTIYRLFLHRLTTFPGPLGAKVSSWWASTLHGKNWKFYEGMAALHAAHGDYVRIGMSPNVVLEPLDTGPNQCRLQRPMRFPLRTLLP